MGILIEELTNRCAVAFGKDAVGRNIHRCSTIPEDTPGTMALIADEQSGEKVRIKMILVILDEWINHDTGLVATDGRHIFLTDDTCFVVSQRNYSYIRTVIALNRQLAIGRLIGFLHGCLFLQVQFIYLAQCLTRSEILEQFIQRQETAADEGCIIVSGLNADTVCPGIIVTIADLHFSSLRIIESLVKCFTGSSRTTLDRDLSMILNGML